jgi:hypothetical protein
LQNYSICLGSVSIGSSINLNLVNARASSSHVGPLFHRLEGFMEIMSRGYGYFCCWDKAGPLGGYGALRREGRGKGCGYSEVLVW